MTLALILRFFFAEFDSFAGQLRHSGLDRPIM